MIGGSLSIATAAPLIGAGNRQHGSKGKIDAARHDYEGHAFRHDSHRRHSVKDSDDIVDRQEGGIQRREHRGNEKNRGWQGKAGQRNSHGPLTRASFCERNDKTG